MSPWRLANLRVPKGQTARGSGPSEHRFTTAAITGFGALVALTVGSAFGNVHGHPLHEKLFALLGALAFVIFAVAAVQSVSGTLAAVVSARAGQSGGSAVKVLTSLVGYVIVIFVGLGMLAVPIQHLLLGGALTGVVVGIAAQQSLGNVFAGLVLLLARPFVIGERIKVRAGALGGVLEGVVASMSLAYVTLHTDEGPVNIPNSAMLAAAVGPAPTPDANQAPSPTSAASTHGDRPVPPPGVPSTMGRFGAKARAARRSGP